MNDKQNSVPVTEDLISPDETSVEEVKDSSSLDTELQLAENLQKALAKQEEYFNMALRTQADFENYKKRNASIRRDAFEEGKADFIKGLLPILDNFERALNLKSEQEQDPILTGIKMIHKQILDLFEKQNIFVIDRKGEVFDPSLEEAVTQGNPEDGDPGTICEVLQKGYRINNIVLRHSMVKVVPL